MVLVTYNSAAVLRPLLASLARAASGISLQCVVVDNASRDGSAEIARECAPDCELIRNPVNVGFARANNQAAKLLTGRYILLLNPDAVLPEDALRKTLAFLESHPGCGILGVKLVSPEGALQPCCRYFPGSLGLFVERAGLRALFPRVRTMDDMGWDHGAVRRCDWVPGCFYLVRKALVDQVGLFDPRYFLYYEEVDHCRAAKAAGWEVVFFPEVTVVHIGGESARSDAAITRAGRQNAALQLESELLYFRKHHGPIGVWLHAVLMTLASTIVGVKALLKRRPSDAWAEIRRSWATFRRTGWGIKPTR